MTAIPYTYVHSPVDSQPVIESFNPATGQKIGEVALTPLDALPAMMARARTAQVGWQRLGLKGRQALFRRFKEVFYLNRDKIIAMIAAEQGKPPFEGLLEEFWPCLETVSYFLRDSSRVLAPRRVWTFLVPHRFQQVERRPHGVVLVIAPWNFPFYLALPQVAAALIAGNTVIYKPSEACPLTGQLLGNLLWEAGIPRDVFQVAQGAGDVAAAMIQERPDKIVFTGSVPTGRKVAMAAAEQLIPVTLELGGKDAAIVLDDADLDQAARGIAFAGLANSGQVCASVERVYVMRSVADQFVQKLTEVIQTHLQERDVHGEVALTPITTPAQLKIIDGQVNEALAGGARAVTGGRVIERDGGRFYAPTVLVDVTPDMRVMCEETFGPVIPVMVVDSDDEAIRRSNEAGFGLLGSVWTRDRARGLRIARELKTGHSSLNDHLISASIPSLPWGGVGLTGHGRTRGPEGLLDMTTPQGVSFDMVRLPIFEELVQFPHTPLKLGVIKRLLMVLYGPTWGERLKALLPRRVE